MRYFLDDEEIRIEDLNKLREEWEDIDHVYENVIIFDCCVNNVMYFCRNSYYGL